MGQDAGRITLWDVATRTVRSELGGHSEVVSSLAYSPDGQVLASSGGDRSVRLWDVAAGRERRVIPGQPGMLVALAFAPDGRTLALADQRSEAVRLWDLAAGAERAGLYGAEGSVLALAISPEGRTLAAADYHGGVHFWELATGRLERSRLEHPGVQTLAFARMGGCSPLEDLMGRSVCGIGRGGTTGTIEAESPRRRSGPPHRAATVRERWSSRRVGVVPRSLTLAARRGGGGRAVGWGWSPAR